MASPSLRVLMLGLIPIALPACTAIEPATGSAISTAPLVGVDLGSSGRSPQIAGLAGEGEGYGRTEPGITPTPAHASMPGMTHGSTGRSSMAGMSQGPMAGMQQGAPSGASADHASTRGISHSSMSGMSHGSPAKTGSAHGSMSAMDHARGKQMQMAHSGHAHVQGTGTVNSIDAAAHKANVSHAPIPTIGWPAMTMDFAVAPSIDLSAVKPGTRIKFDMEQGQDGMYVIQSITPSGGGR